ncbi:hypothetical protein DPMN_147464 [Dreissena polymorpha]|uniref:Uncharacterized protein n=1 Tax=Dreissena polymorpha TaxID=45954 RepID=A0A9D4FDR4_DREPO|nr:hypothetical protein DPMN_147464 [Dreissena polymorpha]
MVDLDVDSKDASVDGHALDIRLKLVGSEYNHKSGNRYNEFVLFLKQRQASSVLPTKTVGLVVNSSSNIPI